MSSPTSTRSWEPPDEVESAREWLEAFASGLRPDPQITVSEWADANRVLTQRSSPEPGQWRTDRTPYLREIMDCLSATSPVEVVVLMKGSQIGGTEVGNNLMGYVIDHAPGPMMVVMPTADVQRRQSRQRIDPLIEDTPSLSAKVVAKKSRDSGNTTLMKVFPGGILVLASAMSASDLRSMPVRVLFEDEIDAYPYDLAEEGDPIDLAERGTRNFANRKIYKCSTPTIDGRSRIQAEFELTDRRYFHVPCPRCGSAQRIEWANIRYEKVEGESSTQRYLDLKEGKREVWLECVTCHGRIEEREKTRMMAEGLWVPEEPGRGMKIRGYHLNALYAPYGFFSWVDAAAGFVRAKETPMRLRVWVNQTLGETWKEKGETPPWRELYKRRERYEIGVVPRGVALLTMGIDLQADRAELEVVGWGAGRQSWSIDYRVLPGDPSEPDLWAKITEAINTGYPLEGSQTQVYASVVGIDSSYRTNQVYAYVRGMPPNRVLAIKGKDTFGGKVVVGTPTAVDVDLGGRRVKRGAKVWPVEVGLLKEELYGWLRMEGPLEEEDEKPAGWCHFPEYPPEWFRQLCAEQLVAHRTKDRVKYAWEKTYERNEALDCRIYARAAAAVAGIDRFDAARWAELEAQLGGTSAPPKRQKKRSDKWRRARSRRRN